MNIRDYFKNSVWESFTAGQGLTLDFTVTVVVSMVLAIVLGMVIYGVYSRFYGGVVFSSSFAVTLVGMAVLTTVLTLAISSNVVISLGMVGALSIVRYRTAVKDPMDLLYLFWSISVGITLGAGLYVMAIVTVPVMVSIIYIFYVRRQKGAIFILVVHYEGSAAGDEIQRILGKMRFQVKSRTIRAHVTELTMEVLCKNNNTLFMEKIEELEDVLDVTLIQYNGEYHG